MIIKIPVRYEGENGEKTLYTLFDSGTTFSCIQPDYIDDIVSIQRLFRPLEVSTASQGTYMRIEQRVVADFYINDIRISDEFMVVLNLSEDTIIGASTMQKWRIKLDFEHDTMIINKSLPMLLVDLRSKSNLAPSFEDITKEVELVRADRY